MRKEACFTVLMVTFLFGGCDWPDPSAKREDPKSLEACEEIIKLALKDGLLKTLRPVADVREDRFLGKLDTGKVDELRAWCRGGEKTIKHRDTPWLDWPNYYATRDASSKTSQIAGLVLYTFKSALDMVGLQVLENDHLTPDGRGVDTALLDLEYQRMELIKFNLFENNTYEEYVKGRYGSSLLRVGDLKDPTRLAVRLRDASDPVSQFLCKQFSSETQQLLSQYNSATPPSKKLQDGLIWELN